VPEVRFSNHKELHEEQGFSRIAFQEGLLKPPCKIEPENDALTSFELCFIYKYSVT
jgi:hypothetical protein